MDNLRNLPVPTTSSLLACLPPQAVMSESASLFSDGLVHRPNSETKNSSIDSMILDVAIDMPKENDNNDYFVVPTPRRSATLEGRERERCLFFEANNCSRDYARMFRTYCEYLILFFQM